MALDPIRVHELFLNDVRLSPFATTGWIALFVERCYRGAKLGAQLPHAHFKSACHGH
jgi:hypothetical protein